MSTGPLWPTVESSCGKQPWETAVCSNLRVTEMRLSWPFLCEAPVRNMLEMHADAEGWKMRNNILIWGQSAWLVVKALTMEKKRTSNYPPLKMRSLMPMLSCRVRKDAWSTAPDALNISTPRHLDTNLTQYRQITSARCMAHWTIELVQVQTCS